MKIFRQNTLLLGAITILALWLLGCFRVRTPEPPDTAGASWTPPTSPDILLSNFGIALQSANVQNYARCFSEQYYKFTPTPFWQNGHENIWQNWGINDEKTYFNNVKTDIKAGSVIILKLNDPLFQNLSADSVNYTATYQLEVPLKDTMERNFFHGKIILKMKLNPAGNVWEIAEWQDLEIHPDSAWSRLKINYIQ